MNRDTVATDAGTADRVMAALSAQDRGELQEHEAVIEKNIVAFRAVGVALLAIRDKRLYRERYGTFDQYCRERWGISKTHANRLIRGSEVVENLAPMGVTPSTERQARELSSLDPDLQREAWSQVIETAPDGKVTAAHVREVVRTMTTEQQQFVTAAAKEVRAQQRTERRQAQVRKAEALPLGKYAVIYADPPWQYSDKLIEGYGAAGHHYQTMSIQQLCELPVRELVADNSVLFLWVTAPFAHDGYHVAEAWGFEYKGQFVWYKVKHNYGHYNSVRHELLLLCTRGKCTPQNSKLFNSVQTIERSNKHSQKPEEFRSIIDAMYPAGPRIELFARAQHDGWDVWGNEVQTSNGAFAS